jgi:hypothetical protein
MFAISLELIAPPFPASVVLLSQTLNANCIVEAANVGSRDADIIDAVRGCLQLGGRNLLLFF